MVANQTPKKATTYLYPWQGTWQFCIPYRNEENKRRQKWVDTGLPIRGNKKKAAKMEEAILLEWMPKLQALGSIGVVTDSSDLIIEQQPQPQKSVDAYQKTLFSDYMLSWLDNAKSCLQVTTYSEYLRIANKVICPYFKEKGIFLEDIKASDIKKFYDHNLKSKSANTVLKYHANIHKALECAVEDDEIRLEANPARRVKLPKKTKYVSEVYNKNDLMKLFEAIRDSYLFTLILVDATYGLRRSELVGLRWSSIDFHRKTLTIRSAAVQCRVDGKYRTVVKPLLKNKSSYRTFSLTPEVEAALLAQKERNIKNQKQYRSKYNKEFLDYIFVNELGELRKPNTVSQYFSKILKKHSLKKIRFHDLRHTCATLLLDGGVSLKDIQYYLGHSQLATTADIYD